MKSINVISLRRNAVKQQLGKILANSENYLIIHYSCESFYDIIDGHTPRITAIAVRYVTNGQTQSFSIHKLAEIKKIKIENIYKKYDILEKEMLSEFFSFVKQHKNYKWIHWNMRDLNYGFQAIENRYRVLSGKPICIDDINKIDLARCLVSLYGPSYSGHPRLEKLLEMNGITNKDFLCGKEEANAFKAKEYVKLQQSTMRKVDTIHTILEKTTDNTLKTKSKLYQIYGITPQGIYELIKDHWFYNLVTFILGLVFGFLVSKF